MTDKKKPGRKKKDEMVEVAIHDKSEPIGGLQVLSDDGETLVVTSGNFGPTVAVELPKERSARLIAETNNFRIVEKFDDETGKIYFEVTNKRTDEAKRFETLSDASTFINNAGLR